MKSDIIAARRTEPVQKTNQRQASFNASDTNATLFHIITSTLARPSVLLGASIGGFVGSISLYTLAKYMGFPYSLTTSLVWLTIGAFAGLIIESVVTLFSRRNR